ncbi:DNA-3-methyladenine glycosylase 2 family protein [Acetobacteraceae bacterium]|nr:DNA-3-methyladenine glycosylase 2 family protein [Acetobacteraceae bacterium]
MQKSHEILWKQAEETLRKEPAFKFWLEQVKLPHWPFQNYMSEQASAEESLVIYFALMRAVVSQQLSTGSAKAILQKLQKIENNHLPLPHHFLTIRDETLKACGLSRQKIRYLRAIAEEAEQKKLPTSQEALAMDSEGLCQRLTDIPGIGDWSADMVMIFALNHPDIFAVGDYGVREGYRLIYQLEKQPSPKALAKAGERFSPYRSLLTGYCWSVKEFIQKRRDLT